MAIPLIPIIMAVAGLASGAIKGVTEMKNAKEEAKATQRQTREQIKERAKDAIRLMNQQKTSFLKAGVYFDNGTPADVIDETYNTMNEDVNAMTTDSNIKVKNLMRQGRTAFFTSLMDGASSGASGFFKAQGK